MSEETQAELVTITVDATVCIAGGQCEMLEPDVFEVDDDEAIAKVLGGGVMRRDRAELVIDRCPSAAIAIVEG